MSEYDNNMRGVLFKNDRKESEKQPDYKGNCEIEGIEYWMNAWIKEAKSGQEYMSFSFSAKEPNQGTTRQKEKPPIDDDIPF